MQDEANTKKTSVKRKRVYHLLPELRRQIPEMFDRMREDDVAEQFGVPKIDVIAEAVRDLRRALRRPPAPARLVVAARERRAA